MNHYDIVLHVDKADNSLAIAFSNAVNYAKALSGEKYTMVLVVNSGAVTKLTKENSELIPALKTASDSGLVIRVCNNALQANNVKAEDLFPECSVVPAGLVEIVNLQREGYAYIKP